MQNMKTLIDLVSNSKGSASAKSIMHANVLLAADENNTGIVQPRLPPSLRLGTNRVFFIAVLALRTVFSCACMNNIATVIVLDVLAI